MRNIRTGKGAFATINGNRVEVTSIKSNLKAEMAKATDSANYVAATDKLYASQVPGEESLEIDIEGNFDLNTVSGDIFALIGNATSVPVIINSSATTTFASGNFDLSTGTSTLEVAGATTYKFSTHLMSNGTFTLGGG